MKKKKIKIKIPKDFFDGLSYKIEVDAESLYAICPCPGCAKRRRDQINTLKKLFKIVKH